MRAHQEGGGLTREERDEIRVRRLGVSDRQIARTTFSVMGDAFGEPHSPLSDTYLDGLLARPDFWAFAATVGDAVVGGLTAHTLPMTAYEGAEVFLYDIAIAASYRRLGIGRRLVEGLRHAAGALGISTVFVPAEDADAEALDFYTALGGSPNKVTLFEFGSG